MEKLSLLFLGTANAIPTQKRNHTAILASFGSENILVDCGEGTQRQFKYANLSPTKITKILITHWHGDHVLGIPGLLQTLAMSNYQKTLKIYGPKGTKENIHSLQQIFQQFRLKLEVHEVSSEKFIDNEEFFIESMPMNHGAPTNAYSIVLKDRIKLDKKKLKKLKLPNSPLIKKLKNGEDIVFNGKKIKSSSVSYKEKGKKISIVLDTAFNENAIKISKDSDILITEATFSEKEEAHAREYKHLTSKDAALIAKKSKSKKLILTHISQRYENNPKIIEKESRKTFKNTVLVKDLDIIVV